MTVQLYSPISAQHEAYVQMTPLGPPPRPKHLPFLPPPPLSRANMSQQTLYAVQPPMGTNNDHVSKTHMPSSLPSLGVPPIPPMSPLTLETCPLLPAKETTESLKLTPTGTTAASPRNTADNSNGTQY
ncbi:hypothetical protein GGI08_003916 [Coemansia sp. S2]|nr:hypothetical protein GGI08_003916 [Coemansia sp. S2]